MCAIAVPICTALAVGGDALSNYIEAKIVEPANRFAEHHHLRFPHHFPTRHHVIAPLPAITP
jgi:hypothetical protein